MDLEIEGIVLNERAHGETSKIINILTRNYGIVGLIAKGARNIKSDFRCSTSKFCFGIFYFRYKEGKLCVLKGVDLKNSFLNIQKNIYRIGYASFLLELTEQVEKHGSNHNLFDLLLASLTKIDEGYNPSIISSILQLKYLKFLGVMPVIDCCCVCGSKNSIVTISSDKGGFICKNCYCGEKIVQEDTIKLIRMFYYVDISKITKLDISLSIIEEIECFLKVYYDKYTGLYFRSKEFLDNINKLSVGGSINE